MGDVVVGLASGWLMDRQRSERVAVEVLQALWQEQPFRAEDVLSEFYGWNDGK